MKKIYKLQCVLLACPEDIPDTLSYTVLLGGWRVDMYVVDIYNAIPCLSPINRSDGVVGYHVSLTAAAERIRS